jgi:predicted secreted protein
MDWVSLAITYVICWWMILFMVLPFGIESSDKNDGVAYPAAPKNARLKRKFLITSLLAIIPALLLQWGFEAAIAEAMR